MSLFLLKIISIGLIFSIALLAGIYPFVKKLLQGKAEFPIGEALAAGVFLGAGLIHMLPDASEGFHRAGFQYPIAAILVGSMFLLLLLLEHIGREVDEHYKNTSAAFALLASAILSIHAFLEGVALGFSSNLMIAIMLLLAILTHKWVAGLSLAITINKSQLSIKLGLMAYGCFVVMTPLGITLGQTVSLNFHHEELFEPIFMALAAGTFLYLGTLHGLKQAVLVDKCCNLRHFLFVILGFSVMALVAFCG